MENRYPEYCITNCPVGKLVAEGLIRDCDSAVEAADKMRCYVDSCRGRGCPQLEATYREPEQSR